MQNVDDNTWIFDQIPLSTSTSEETGMGTGMQFFDQPMDHELCTSMEMVDHHCASHIPSTANIPSSSCQHLLSAFGPVDDYRTNSSRSQNGLFSSASSSAEKVRSSTEHVSHSTRTSDCTALALRVLAEMHVSGLNCTTRTHGLKDKARDVNTVLYKNREAIHTISPIVECSCFAELPCALAVYLVTQKVVAWYAAAIGVPDNGSDNGRSLGGNECDQHMTDLVIERPLYLGSFCLDTGSGSQRGVRAQVILAELQEHVQPFIAQLAQGQSARIATGCPGSSRATSLQASADFVESQYWELREQLTRVIAQANSVR